MTGSLNLSSVLPELLLVLAALVLLMRGVFMKRDSTRSTTWLAVGVLLVAAVLVLVYSRGDTLAFGGMFIADKFSAFVKVMILAASALTALMSLPYLEEEKLGRFEYPVLVLFATTGMMMMVSANSFMSLYLGLELQSLSLYVLAAYHRDNARSTEAGLKYFVLGALASGMLLYGISLVYGFSGSMSFPVLAGLFGGEHHGAPHLGVIAGLVFILAGLAFKLSAAPFHMWAPDVYEGAPTPVTSFFAVAPKIAAVALVARVMIGPFGEMGDQWRQVVSVIAILSMFIGAFAAIVQTNIKRLMAYSSIGHVGFILVGLAAGLMGVKGMLIYLAAYVIMNVGTFAIILSMRRGGRMVEDINDLAGLSKTRPMMALAMVIMMFSMAGIPPMAGFFGKLFVFEAAVAAGLFPLAILGILTSVVSAFYYLRIIKVMYFDEAAEPFDRPSSRIMGVVMAVSAVAVVVFPLFPMPSLERGANAAAGSFQAPIATEGSVVVTPPPPPPAEAVAKPG